MFEKIICKDQVLAIIIYANYKAEGISFFTPDNYPQQLAYMNRPKGYKIVPHVHNPVIREVMFTQEVLFIKTGKIRIDFYEESKKYIESRVIQKGDVVLLANGGHGFEMLEESEIIEVKQGPYQGELDKIRFDSVAAEDVKVRE